MDFAEITGWASGLTKSIVSAMATETWSEVRKHVLGVWRRHAGAAETDKVEVLLDQGHKDIDGEHSDWQSDLALAISTLLRHHEDAKDDLVAAMPQVTGASKITVRVKGSFNRTYTFGHNAAITITKGALGTSLIVIAVLMFVAGLVTYLVLRPNEPTTAAAEPLHVSTTDTQAALPTSCGPLPSTGQAGQPVDDYLYKVTSGPGSTPHQIQRGGSISQAFATRATYVIQISVIIGTSDAGSHPVEFQILSASGTVLTSVDTVQDATNNNRDVAAPVNRLPVRSDSIVILKVINKSNETLGIYLNDSAGQLVPAPYSACIDGEFQVLGRHPDRGRQILSGSVLGSD